MEAMLTKENLIKAVQALPDRYTVDDVIERILLLESIEEARAQIRNGEGIPDEDLDKHLPEWLRSNGPLAH